MVRIIGEFAAAVAEVETESEAIEPRGFALGPNKAIFFIDPDIGFIPFGKFSQAASSGLDTAEMEGAAAVMDMMRDIIGADPGDPGDPEADPPVPARPARTREQEYGRFCDIASRAKIKMPVLLDIIGTVFSGDAGRPSQPLSDSANGQSLGEISPSSSRKSSSGGRRRRLPPGTTGEMEPVTDAIIREVGG
jgi:hypothetical protein